MCFLSVKKAYQQKGFTLLESLLSIAILGIVVAVGVPVLQSVQVRNDIEVDVNAVVSGLRYAQTLSRSGEGDTTWGVKIVSDTVVVFKGVDYASRDSAYDEVLSLSKSVTYSGIDEVVYQKMSGLPGSTGTITLTSSINDVRNITINEKGTIEF